MDIKSDRLKGKKIALCVTGSIAAVECVRLARELRRHGADVQGYMTESSMEIMHPDALEFATTRDVITRLTGKLEHLRQFDLILIAPATANTISKIACGIGDTVVTALVLSSDAQVLIAPAMHRSMHSNRIIQDNIKRLRDMGFKFICPKFEEGKAKLAGVEDIVDAVLNEFTKKDLQGINVLVTAGPTVEYIDPVRVITNKSSGKMGMAIAREARLQGAEVKVIYGPGTEPVPGGIETIRVESADEMLKAVKKDIGWADVFISAAAVSDFSARVSKRKIDSKKPVKLELVPTPKILKEIKGITGSDTTKIGFKALYNVSEKELTRSALKLLEEYGLDMVVANDVSKGIFGSNTSEVYIVKKDETIHIPRRNKSEIAKEMLTLIKQYINKKGL